MIARLLFKAVLSVALLLGVASYGHHLTGGDPGALWGRVAGGALEGVAGTFDGLRGQVVAPAAALVGAPDGGSRHDSVWTWRDAGGVVHYASTPPGGIDATLVTVDPDVNVLAPVVPMATDRSPGDGVGVRVGTTGAGTAHGSSRHGRDEADEGGALPGIAGAMRRARGDAPAPDPARAEALLRRLQPSPR